MREEEDVEDGYVDEVEGEREEGGKGGALVRVDEMEGGGESSAGARGGVS